MFIVNLITRRPQSTESTDELAMVIPKGSRIVLVESRNPDHVEFTLGPDRYWIFKAKWNDASVRRAS
jgi:hypothetical protein